MNNAKCVDGVDSYKCTCLAGYFGYACETGRFGLDELIFVFHISWINTIGSRETISSYFKRCKKIFLTKVAIIGLGNIPLTNKLTSKSKLYLFHPYHGAYQHNLAFF